MSGIETHYRKHIPQAIVLHIVIVDSRASYRCLIKLNEWKNVCVPFGGTITDGAGQRKGEVLKQNMRQLQPQKKSKCPDVGRCQVG